MNERALCRLAIYESMYVSNILEKACTRDLHYFPCLHIWKLRSLQRQQWKITIKNWISTGTDIATTFKKCDDNLQCVLLICWQPLLIRFKCLLRWFVVFTIGEALSSQFSGNRHSKQMIIYYTDFSKVYEEVSFLGQAFNGYNM